MNKTILLLIISILLVSCSNEIIQTTPDFQIKIEEGSYMLTDTIEITLDMNFDQTYYDKNISFTFYDGNNLIAEKNIVLGEENKIKLLPSGTGIRNITAMFNENGWIKASTEVNINPITVMTESENFYANITPSQFYAQKFSINSDLDLTKIEVLTKLSKKGPVTMNLYADNNNTVGNLLASKTLNKDITENFEWIDFNILASLQEGDYWIVLSTTEDITIQWMNIKNSASLYKNILNSSKWKEADFEFLYKIYGVAYN